MQSPDQIGSTGEVAEGKPKDSSSKNNDKLGRSFSQFTRFMSQDWQQPGTSEIDNQLDAQVSEPALKTEAISFVRFLIRLLEGVVEKLETKPPPGASPVTPSQFWIWWEDVLTNIRATLPEFFNQVLSDLALTVLISVAILIVVFSLVGSLIPEKATEVAQMPTTTEKPLAPEVVETEVAQMPTTTEDPPGPEVVESDTVTPEAPGPEVTTPTESAGGPVPAEKLSAPVLTPEQNLIAIIQNQAASLIPEAEYAEGLIQSLKADINNNLLVVKVNDDWYNLSPEIQNEFANEMRQRSKELDFSKLEITDEQDTLLARSPLVGPKMVIFQRRQLAIND